MGKTLVLGAGICGLGAALLLARDGQRIPISFAQRIAKAMDAMKGSAPRPLPGLTRDQLVELAS
ncbi:MAG TPA: hypothetical protein VFR18_14570 [Terriglobia bacterium]|nr:hypothetical protein [Terriglobia bacterium]